MSEKIKKLRQQQALSLSDLAKLTKLSRVTINRIENGKQKPMPRTIRRLAKALRVRVQELTSEEAKSHQGLEASKSTLGNRGS
jgi:transcriptional regulator with XRE-family HTH domain